MSDDDIGAVFAHQPVIRSAFIGFVGVFLSIDVKDRAPRLPRDPAFGGFQFRHIFQGEHTWRYWIFFSVNALEKRFRHIFPECHPADPDFERIAAELQLRLNEGGPCSGFDAQLQFLRKIFRVNLLEACRIGDTPDLPSGGIERD